MGTKTRSIVWGLLFLVLAEFALRAGEARAVPTGSLPSERPLCLALGTSRTEHAVQPAIAENALQEAGIDNVWVANVSEVALTMVGLYRRYMQEIHPRVAGDSKPRILAIEVRGSGLNDSHMEERELLYVRQQGFDRAHAQTADMTFGVDAFAQRLLSQLALSRAREIIERVLDPKELAQPEWMEGRKGWMVFTGPSPQDMKANLNRERYRNKLLADYRVGGIQTDFLRRLVEQAQADGWSVVLFIPPVTLTQREFWKPEDLNTFRAHIADFARANGLPFLDFDLDHNFKLNEFFDTHHLNRKGSRRFSRLWARRIAQAVAD